MHKSIIFFIDFHENSGLGHLNRCLKLKKIFKIKDVTFVTQTKINLPYIKCVNNTFDKFIKNNKKKYDLAVFDSYDQNYKNQKKFSKFVSKIIVIDDLCKNKFYCDYLINYNPYIKEINYKNKISKKTLLLMGINYNFILNNESKIKLNYSNKNNIFIYFGKKNRSSIIKKILISLKNLKKSINEINIVSNYPVRSNEFPNLKILKINKNINIKRLINKSEICIISAGIILYEAINQKKIIFSKPISVNQLKHFYFLEKNKNILSLDKLRNINKKKLNEYKKNINFDLVTKKNNIIFNLIKKPIYTDDMKTINLKYYNSKFINDIYLMQTRNYRKYYVNKKTFSYLSHKKYFNKIHNNKNINFLVINLQNKFAGYVKIEEIKKLSIISIAIKSKYQNLKIATKVLKFLSKNYDFNGIPTAYINKENIHSYKAFKNANIKNIKYF